MRMKIMILTLAVFVIALIFTSCSSGNSMEAIENQDSVADEMETSMLLAGTTSPYSTFTQEAYEEALSENKIILLYFYADWCPICIHEENETYATFNELQNGNLVGFRVNYKDSQTDDNEEAIARKFGVAFQHTKVILKNGEIVVKAPDSWNKERYLSEIAKVQ